MIDRFQRSARLGLVLLLLWLVHLSALAAPGESTASGPAWREDQILIQPKAGLAPEKLAGFHAAHGAKVRGAFSSLGHVQIISLPKGETVPGFVAQYQQSGLVDYAEPDYVRHINLTAPNDPRYLDGTLWGLNNFGQNGGTPHADINAPEGWDLATSAGSIIVAVLDTGVRYSHEDLAANMWSNPNDGSHGTNAVADNNDPNDDNGHGTLMAGVLGAVGNNGKGVVGVAWQVQIMACKCFNGGGGGSDSAIIACIDFAVVNGARIINASFDSPAFSLSLSNAIYNARQAGVVFVASCGNSNPGINVDISPRYPACYQIDNVVSVAYTTRNDGLGGLSNFGATNVDLAAPGDQITSTFNTSDSAYFPPLGIPINLAGTSYAAAYVSGALALMLSHCPGKTHQQTIHSLLAGADPLPALAGKYVSGGRLNLRKALSRCEAPEIVTQPVSLTNIAGSVAKFSVTAGGLQPLGYQWRKEGVSLVDGGQVAGATATTLTIADVQPADAGTYTVLITNQAGSTLSDPAQLTVLVPPTARIRIFPLAEFPGLTNLIVIAPDSTHATLVLDGSLSTSGNNAPLTFQWFEGTNLLSTAATITNDFAVGSHSFTLEVSDGTLQETAVALVEIITSAQSVALLGGLVETSGLDPSRQHPLLVTLEAAAASFDRGNHGAGLNQLGAFQHKVNAQVAGANPRLAAQLTASAQTIIDALSR